MSRKYVFPVYLILVLLFTISLPNHAQVIKKLSSANPPVVDFTYSPSQICIGEVVQFTDLSTNSPTQWFWEFQGAVPSTSTAQNPQVVYTGSGNFSVKLRATNSNGTDSLTKNNFVFVQGVPSLSVVDPQNYCDNQDINVSIEANRYDGQWDSTAWNPSKDTAIFNPSDLGPGNYALAYSLASSNGCVARDTANFTVFSSPTAQMAPLDTICQGDDPFTLANGTPPGGNYIGAGVSGGVMDPGAVGSGVYAIKYIYADNNGCTDSALTLLAVDVCAGIESPILMTHVSVYPNPVMNELHLEMEKNTGDYQILVLDQTGRELTLNFIGISENHLVLSTEDYSTGTFYLQVCDKETNGRCETLTLIKLPN